MSQHGTTPDLSWASMVEALSQAADISADLDAQIAAWLLDGSERLLVDLGCGAGGMAVALRSAADASARVVAVDGEPALLEATRRRAAATGNDSGLETVRADLAAEIPISAGSADLIWASAVVHHLPDQQAALGDLASRLAPGGRLALAEGGLSARSLPWDIGIGEPGLELRLDAAGQRWFAQMRLDLPGSVPMPYGWPRALREAGLVDIGSKTFLLDLPAPLRARDAEHALGRLRSFLDRDSLAALVGDEDRAVLARLTDLDDPIHHDSAPEFFLLAAYTVHVGQRPTQ
ncbi:methyltransferase domain-containing protein [soil metagenome]